MTSLPIHFPAVGYLLCKAFTAGDQIGVASKWVCKILYDKQSDDFRIVSMVLSTADYEFSDKLCVQAIKCLSYVNTTFNFPLTNTVLVWKKYIQNNSTRHHFWSWILFYSNLFTFAMRLTCNRKLTKMSPIIWLCVRGFRDFSVGVDFHFKYQKPLYFLAAASTFNLSKIHFSLLLLTGNCLLVSPLMSCFKWAIKAVLRLLNLHTAYNVISNNHENPHL